MALQQSLSWLFRGQTEMLKYCDILDSRILWAEEIIVTQGENKWN
jgi:hypothetical protein